VAGADPGGPVLSTGRALRRRSRLTLRFFFEELQLDALSANAGVSMCLGMDMTLRRALHQSRVMNDHCNLTRGTAVAVVPASANYTQNTDPHRVDWNDNRNVVEHLLAPGMWRSEPGGVGRWGTRGRAVTRRKASVEDFELVFLAPAYGEGSSTPPVLGSARAGI